MSSLLRFPWKLRAVSTSGKSTVITTRRALVAGAKNYSERIDAQDNSTKLKIGNSDFRRNFRLSASRASDLLKNANIDSNNVLRSPYEKVLNFTGIRVHDLVWENLNRWPDRTALVCSETGRSYTYAQLRKLSGKLAASLRRRNLRPGDAIATVLPNVPEFGILVLGASEAGLRLILMNPAYTAHEIRGLLNIARASAIVTVPSRYSTVATSVADYPLTLPIVVIEDGSDTIPAGTVKFAELLGNDVEEFEKTGEKTGIDPEDTFIMPHSSGTTGLPKVVELSHRNIVVNIKQSRADGVSLATEASATHQEILPLVLPIFHIYGLTVCLSQYLCMGGKLICVPQFTPDRMFRVLEEYRTTTFYLAPPLLQLLANDPRLNESHLESVRTVISGAAPTGEEVIAKFRSRAPAGLRLVQGYGLTECSPTVALSAVAPTTSNGHLVPNTEIRIVDYHAKSEGQNLGPNEIGEIYIKGPQVMKGYHRNPEATADCMDGDWFKTGDLGLYDENGFVYIRGRLKELIKVQSYQVAPAEIEDVLQGHEKVLDAAVIGVPHEKYGEIPKAFVVAKSGCRIEADEMKSWVAERLAKHKRLGEVRFVEKIPKSAAGKILRRELKDM